MGWSTSQKHVRNPLIPSWIFFRRLGKLHWRRLNCIGSLKVLNNVTLWAPNLSWSYSFEQEWLPSWVCLLCDVILHTSISQKAILNYCKKKLHLLQSFKIEYRPNFKKCNYLLLPSIWTQISLILSGNEFQHGYWIDRHFRLIKNDTCEEEKNKSFRWYSQWIYCPFIL